MRSGERIVDGAPAWLFQPLPRPVEVHVIGTVGIKIAGVWIDSPIVSCGPASTIRDIRAVVAAWRRGRGASP